jgi:ADP-ribose pyrophosphatase YjhB (NUDIX family)
VVLVPTDRGVVLIRRGVEPERTKWALPGGYIHAEETWRQAGAREVMEETGIEVDPSAIEDFCVRSAPDGTLLVFGVAGAVRAEDLPAFEPGPEALERTVVSTPPPDMAFALHREALESYLEGRKPQHG